MTHLTRLPMADAFESRKVGRRVPAHRPAGRGLYASTESDRACQLR